MLKRVHIKGYKSLADVELCLEPLTVLILIVARHVGQYPRRLESPHLGT